MRYRSSERLSLEDFRQKHVLSITLDKRTQFPSITYLGKVHGLNFPCFPHSL